MNSEELRDLVVRGFSIREISSEVSLSPTTVRYWLKKFSLRTLERPKLPKRLGGSTSEKKCPRCGETKCYSEFYSRRDKTEPSVYCKPCTSDQTMERMRAFKLRCLEACGPFCAICGYDKCVSALEFHHLNASEKDFSIANLRSYSFSEVVREELSKCVTLCANCHREVHSGLTPVPERASTS